MAIFHDDYLPVGFSIGLAMDLTAMSRFSRMTEAEKEEVLNRARDAKSKSEMQDIISRLSDDTDM